MESASDSMMMCEMFKSWVSSTPYSRALPSTFSTKYWAESVLLSAAETRPLESLMIMPMLDVLLSFEVASITLILKKPIGGANHLTD